VLLYIRNHPGTHLRQIKRDLDISMGVTQYHLSSLERSQQIIARRGGLYKRFYLALAFGEHQQEILDVLSQETERDLMLFLIQKPWATQKDLSEYARISPGTINWHMKRLIAAKLVSTKRAGQFVMYSITVDSDEIITLLRSYHPSTWEKWADRIANVVNELSNIEPEGEEKS
jgi:predicted transcriptional regulator